MRFLNSYGVDGSIDLEITLPLPTYLKPKALVDRPEVSTMLNFSRGTVLGLTHKGYTSNNTRMKHRS